MINEMHKKVCCKPFYYAEVHQDGETTPCCLDYCRRYSFGNVINNQLDEVWNSKKAQFFRKKILNSDYSLCNLDLCKPENFLSKEEVLEKYYTNGIINPPETFLMSYDQECNVACITCRDNIYHNTDKELKILNGISKNIIDNLHGCTTFFLSGGGDPFGSRYARSLIHQISLKYPKIKFRIITNGISCTQKMCEKLEIKDKIEYISISIHASQKNTYEKIVKYGNFDKVMHNLEWISEAKKRGNINVIELLFVVHKLNYKEIPDFVELAKKFDANTVFTQFRPLGTHFSDSYKNQAIFLPSHPAYWKFLKVMGDKSLQSPRCSYDGTLQEAVNMKYRYIKILKLQIIYYGKYIANFIKLKFLNLLKIRNSFKMKEIFKNIKLESYQEYLLDYFLKTYTFKNKKVLEIGSDTKLQTAQAIVAYGAKEVWAVNPAFGDNLQTPLRAIHMLKTTGEEAGLPEHSFDVIFGIALLEHVNHPHQLALECKKLLKPGGICFLQGHPMWTSATGHHVWLPALQPDGISFFFFNESSPFLPWQHLTCHTEEELASIVEKKGIPGQYTQEIWRQVYHDAHISRLTPTEIIREFTHVADMDVQCVRQYSSSMPNEYYSEAVQKFSEDDLKTCELRIFMTHSGYSKPEKPTITDAKSIFVPLGTSNMISYFLFAEHKGIQTKLEYMDLPFNEAWTPYFSMLHFLMTNFDDYFEGLTFDENNKYWVNIKHQIYYNHDTDCGIHDKQKILVKLKNRLDNFRTLFNYKKNIMFVYCSYFSNNNASDINKLYAKIKELRKGKKFQFIVFGDESYLDTLPPDIIVHKIEYPFADPQDWWRNDPLQAAVRAEFQKEIIDCVKQDSSFIFHLIKEISTTVKHFKWTFK